ncbi:MAG: DUF4367 domain-containing protein [Clostridia bacterium]|nr:DUF4367 domain-containing protein [Clostridia bacterium]
MAAIEKELADAFGEIIDAEIESALSEAGSEQHEFSPKFKKQMEELIRTGKPNNKAASRRSARRIVLIAIAAVLALALAACAIPQVREFIAGFFVQHKDDHDEYAEPEVTKERIEEEYGLVPIPEGFSIVEITRLNNFIATTYMNESQTAIQLIQGSVGYDGDVIDNEKGSFSEYTVGSKTVRMYFSDYFAQASWIQDGYYFSISYNASIQLKDFEKLIENVNPK